ncbi:MAG: nucleotidyltransferase family protein [Roseobacter sp.]
MPDTPCSVMIFAAGFGTRMRPLTDRMPKPLIAVAGRPLIDHALSLTTGIEAKRVVANLHYKADQLVDHLGGSSVKTVLETPQILDTGGGLKNALPVLQDSPVYTLNSDAIWVGENPLQTLKSAWQPAKMDALLAVVPFANTVGYAGSGDFSMDGNTRLGRGAGFVYGGAQIIKTEVLAEISDTVFSLNLVWDLLARKGTLFGCAYPGKWCDVGHPAGIGLAETLLEQADV